MPEKILEYKSDKIKITYNPKLCIHAAECANGLPEVFNPNNKPWVNAEGAEVNEIITVIKKCPTGALKYEGPGIPNEIAEQPGKITTVKNGPIYLQGNVSIVNSSGEKVAEETRVALCRCGHSENKPFCDNKHLEVNFNAD